jgi:DNA-binding CsgD family transcriptional regulator
MTLRAVLEGDERRFAAGLVWLQARALADIAEQAAARRDDAAVAHARGLGAELAAEAAGTLGGAQGPVVRPEEEALAATARAELRRLAGADATPAWVEAVDRWTALGSGLPLAYARWREAEARVAARGPFERTVSAVREAMSAATALRARLLVDEVAQLARVARVEVRAPRRGSPSRPATDGTPSSGTSPSTSSASSSRPLRVPEPRAADVLLTPREREVLAGLVAGRTNGEIARALFISVKTASVHVSNILRKLDVPNREQAARLGYRLGLTSSDGGDGPADG